MLSQAIDESPVEDVEEDKKQGEEDARAFVDPRCDLLRRHCSPSVFWRLVGTLAATRPTPLARHQLVIALRGDCR